MATIIKKKSRGILPKTRAMRYGYSNARVRAMRGLLIRQSALEDMIRVGTVEGVVELLQKTDYKLDLAGVSIHKGSRMIDAAVSRNFARTIRKLMKITPESDRGALRALLIRWDLLNLKTLLHARRLKKSYDEVRPYLFEVGGLTEEDFKRIMKAEDAALLKELKKTELGARMVSLSSLSASRRKAMQQTYAEAMRSPAATILQDNAIDTYLYLFSDNALAEIGSEVNDIRKTLKKEADAKNIMIIERLKKHNSPKEKIEASLIKGGTLSASVIQRITEAKDLSAVVNAVKSNFPKLEPKSEGKAGLTQLEIALEKSVAAQRVSAFHRSVLSIGVILGFLFLKEEEMNNLRKIAKGKEFNMKESEVRETLVLV